LEPLSESVPDGIGNRAQPQPDNPGAVGPRTLLREQRVHVVAERVADVSRKEAQQKAICARALWRHLVTVP